MMAAHVAGSTPYPWPWNGDLIGSGTGVVIVLPAGVAAPDAVVLASMHAVATAVRRAGGLVVLVTTRPPGRADARTGARPMLVEPDLVDHHIESGGVDGFFGSRLDALLRSASIERLILVGAGLETCVHSTMRSANDRGYECLLVTDAVAAYDPDLVRASVSMIEMSGGIFGAVARADAVTAAFEGETR